MKTKQKENPFGVKILADKPVISIDKSCTRIIEIVITPPDVEEKKERSPLNLSLVLDRSGSMQGEKLHFVKQAASHVLDLLGPQDRHLDAIERVLRQRLHGWLKTGKVFASITGWELATGKARTRKDIYALYKRPADRDFRRDYVEGVPSFGSAPPEGLVYFTEVLAYYLKHRPVERLLAPPKADEPLGQVLGRVPGESP